MLMATKSASLGDPNYPVPQGPDFYQSLLNTYEANKDLVNPPTQEQKQQLLNGMSMILGEGVGVLPAAAYTALGPAAQGIYESATGKKKPGKGLRRFLGRSVGAGLGTLGLPMLLNNTSGLGAHKLNTGNPGMDSKINLLAGGISPLAGALLGGYLGGKVVGD